MSAENTNSDLDKIANNYRSLAEAMLQIKNSPLVHDPDFLKVLKDLKNALAIHTEQIRLLNEPAVRREILARGSSPTLCLVKH